MSETQIMEGKEADQVAMTLAGVKRQVNLIQQVMRSEMTDGMHYGTIPGCGDKPALLKAGAEKLNLTFRMAPRFDITITQMGNGHREYSIKTSLFHIDTGKFLGEGLGSCSTMESKYRYRAGDGEDTGKMVSKEYWDTRKTDAGKAQELLGGKGFVTKKVDGVWKIFKKGEKVDNPDIADVYNTVFKMAKKRSHVDATLSATAASDIFTQDIEEMAEDAPIVEPVKTPQPISNGKPSPAPDPKAKLNPQQLNFLQRRLEEMGADEAEVGIFISSKFKKKTLTELTGEEAGIVLRTWKGEPEVAEFK